MTIAVRGKSFQVRVKEPNGGKYHRYSFPSLEEAQDFEQAALEAISRGLSVPDPYATGPVSLRELTEKYHAHIWPNQEYKQVKTDLSRFFDIVPNDLSKLTTKHILQFVHKRRNQGVKDQTIRHNINRLRSILKHAAQMEDITHPEGIDWPTLKTADSRYRFLTPDEETKLQSFLAPSDIEAMHFLIDTGMRPGEVFQTRAYNAEPFEWADVSTAKDGRKLVTLWRTKTGKTRTVPLTDRAADTLSARLERGEPSPFAHEDYDAFKANVCKAAREAGLEDVVVYTFRHTCATRLVQRGADIRRVMVWMGHSNIETTLKYAKLVPEDIYTLADLL